VTTRPLDGIRVVDCTHVLAGPYCTYQLALLGADVIKVESPDGDMVRIWGGSFEQMSMGLGTGFVSQNAGKRSLCVDLKQPDGRDLVLRLAERADVFIENYRPGALAKCGLGYDDVRARNSTIVYASVTAFGQNGPHGHRPGFDDVVQGTSGFMSENTRAEGPIRTGGPILDFATGMHAASSILAALLLRAKTGESQRIDMAMQDVTMLLVNYRTALTSAVGGEPELETDIQGVMLGRFPAKEGYVMLAGYLPKHCSAIARAIGLDQYVDITFPDMFERRAEIQAVVEARIREKTASEWDVVFDQAGVVGGAVRDLAEVFETGQPEARQITEPLETAAGEIHVTKNGYLVNGQSWGPAFGVPRLGEHNREILSELDLSEAEIERLISLGAVRQAPDPGSV
jgi:crotonobetainyl-CoA:carnitine CoA-transferase CaiB-like acyl-CoA transferase